MDKSEQLLTLHNMGRKRKLTDYLPVARHGNKRDRLVKGKQETDDGESTARSPTADNTAGDTEQGDVARPPEPSPLDKLIQFDLDWRFGPCTGITRLERWRRAEELGLTPPKNIRDILTAHHAEAQYQCNLWSSYAL